MILNHLKRKLLWNVLKSVVCDYMGATETEEIQTSTFFDTEATYRNSMFSGLCLRAVKVLRLTITSVVLRGAVASAVTAFILQYLGRWAIVKYSQVCVVEEQCLKMFLNSGCHSPFRCQLPKLGLVSSIAAWRGSMPITAFKLYTWYVPLLKADLVPAPFGGSGIAAYLWVVTNQAFSSNSRNEMTIKDHT